MTTTSDEGSERVLDFAQGDIQAWRLRGSSDALDVILRRVADETRFNGTKFEINNAAFSGNRKGFTLALSGKTLIGRFAIEELPLDACQIRLRKEDVTDEHVDAIEAFFAAALPELQAEGFDLLPPPDSEEAPFSSDTQRRYREALYEIEARLIASAELTLDEVQRARAEIAVLRDSLTTLPRGSWKRLAGKIFGAFANGVLGIAAKAVILQITTDLSTRLGSDVFLPSGEDSGGGSAW